MDTVIKEVINISKVDIKITLHLARLNSNNKAMEPMADLL
jgi:hypothetical protein